MYVFRIRRESYKRKESGEGFLCVCERCSKVPFEWNDPSDDQLSKFRMRNQQPSKAIDAAAVFPATAFTAPQTPA